MIVILQLQLTMLFSVGVSQFTLCKLVDVLKELDIALINNLWKIFTARI